MGFTLVLMGGYLHHISINVQETAEAVLVILIQVHAFGMHLDLRSRYIQEGHCSNFIMVRFYLDLTEPRYRLPIELLSRSVIYPIIIT